MAVFEQLSNVEALELSLEAAAHLTAAHAAAVATARSLAARVDLLVEDDWEVDGKLDNVTVPTYLKSLQVLGLTPGVAADGAKGKPRNDLEAFKQRAAARRADRAADLDEASS